MKIKLDSTVTVKPFRAPNFVMLDGPTTEPDDKVPLSAVSAFDLEKLCDNFRSEVFRKAGKERPPQACSCG